MAAGTAQTTKFLMGTATLMFGPMSAAFDLLPATNSVGLVKNFQLSSEPSFVELTQGTKNTLVFSVMNGNPVKGQAEVYEYTAKNLAYAMGLDGSQFAPVATPATALTAPVVSGDTTVAVADATGMANGKYLMFSDSTQEDVVLVRKITNVAALVITLDAAINSAWATATTVVKIVNMVPLGSTDANPFLSCKAVGLLADGTPVEAILPKVRITKGFTLAFNSEQYSNMPFEIEVYDLVPTDAFYANFKNRKGSLHLA